MQIFSKLTLLVFLTISCGIFAVAKGQEPRISDLEMSNEVYLYESGLYIAPNTVIRIRTPHHDTLYVANRTWFSKIKAPNYTGECIYDSLNIDKVSIDSIAVFVGAKNKDGSTSVIWSKILLSRGQSELINYPFGLPSGDIMVIREVYRRAFDCNANIWFFIKQKVKPVSIKDL